jgi:hypothetical protein
MRDGINLFYVGRPSDRRSIPDMDESILLDATYWQRCGAHKLPKAYPHLSTQY